MRIFSWIVVALVIVSCKSEQKQQQYVSLKGKVNSSEIASFQVASRDYSKTITVDENGVFDDTLKVEAGFFGLLNGQNDGMYVFLRNGFDLEISFKGARFSEGEDSL